MFNHLKTITKMLTVYSTFTIPLFVKSKQKSLLCASANENQGEKHTPPHPSTKHNNKKDKEIKKKKLKILCPSQGFCSIHCDWPCTWSYSLITAGTSLPASISMSFLCVHCSCALSTVLGKSPQMPAQMHTVFSSQWTWQK